MRKSYREAKAVANKVLIQLKTVFRCFLYVRKIKALGKAVGHKVSFPQFLYEHHEIGTVELSQSHINRAYLCLHEALKATVLPSNNGGFKLLDNPGEFMLMHGEEGRWAFKHYNTRNYLYCDINRLIRVPRTNLAFSRGEF
jgi:hypothetical protein